MEDANLNENQLRKIGKNNGSESKKIANRMQTYTSNILVSNTYFYTKRRELETLTNQEDPCTVVYTLSAVENHWVDLHRLLYRKFSLPNISHPIKNIWWKRNTSCRFRHMWIQFSVSA